MQPIRYEEYADMEGFCRQLHKHLHTSYQYNNTIDIMYGEAQRQLDTCK